MDISNAQIRFVVVPLPPNAGEEFDNRHGLVNVTTEIKIGGGWFMFGAGEVMLEELSDHVRLTREEILAQYPERIRQ